MIRYLRILSDIHLEFQPFFLPKLDTDNETILVLAGDIGVGTSGVDLLEEVYQRFPHIVYVLGNHCYYGHDIGQVRGAIRFKLSELGIENVSVIDDAELIEIEGLKFACGTLWTSMNNNDPLTHNIVGNGLNDFVKIRNGNRRFTTEDAMEIFNETVLKFKEWIDSDTIVITHHMPSELCVSTQFKDSHHMNGGFRSNLHNLILETNPKLWIHGHGHNSVHTTIGDTKIIANPRGYPHYNLTNENNEFDPKLLIEL